MTQSKPKPCLIYGDYHGLATWCYVLVDRLKLPLLLRRPKGASVVELKQFGEVICSGWGKQPPESVKAQIREQYGE